MLAPRVSDINMTDMNTYRLSRVQYAVPCSSAAPCDLFHSLGLDVVVEFLFHVVTLSGKLVWVRDGYGGGQS